MSGEDQMTLRELVLQSLDRMEKVVNSVSSSQLVMGARLSHAEEHILELKDDVEKIIEQHATMGPHDKAINQLMVDMKEVNGKVEANAREVASLREQTKPIAELARKIDVVSEVGQQVKIKEAVMSSEIARQGKNWAVVVGIGVMVITTIINVVIDFIVRGGLKIP